MLAAGLSAAWLLWPRPPPPLQIVAPTARPTASPAPPLVVQVAGAVATPGVYQLPVGSRVDEAVALAGGLTEEADPASLNLAARLVDGQQIVVRVRPALPTSRASPGPADAPPPGRVNLNQASLADLDALPGVGPVLAQRIVERRQRVGPFQSVEQLRDEKLLPGPTFERIKELVSVN